MSEADKYTTEMWQSHLGSVVSVMNASDAKREAFLIGFNGKPASPIVHYSARPAWHLGRHCAILLGYIKP